MGSRAALIIPVAALLAACGSQPPSAQAPVSPTSRLTSSPPPSITPGDAPEARFGAAMAYDEANETSVLFGGQGQSAYLSDTWTWNGQRWLQQRPTVSPPPRSGAGMVYSAATKTVVLFGGTGLVSAYEIGALSDTWTWNGKTWTQQHPTVTPPPRHGFSMADDKATHEVVLFGGDSGTRVPVLLNDTWVWNSTNWSLRRQARSPAGRVDASLAYSAAAQELVLFGGANGMALGDTWAWTGQMWTQRAPSLSPGPRYGASAAYSSMNGEVLLVGGYDANLVRLDETWAWNGITWSKLLVPNHPEARVLASLSADVAGGVVLFGGSGFRPKTVSNFLNDTSTWDGRRWNPAK